MHECSTRCRRSFLSIRNILKNRPRSVPAGDKNFLKVLVKLMKSLLSSWMPTVYFQQMKSKCSTVHLIRYRKLKPSRYPNYLKKKQRRFNFQIKRVLEYRAEQKKRKKTAVALNLDGIIGKSSKMKIYYNLLSGANQDSWLYHTGMIGIENARSFTE